MHDGVADGVAGSGVFAVAEGQVELVIEKWPKGFGFSTDDDCLVTGCGGAAADAGVTVGSVIVAVAGQSVASKADTTEVAFVLQVCTHRCWAVVALCVGHGPDPELLAATAGGNSAGGRHDGDMSTYELQGQWTVARPASPVVLIILTKAARFSKFYNILWCH